MLKKYFPFIALIAAALLFWYIKKYQRGPTTIKPPIEQTDTAVKIPVVISPESNNNRDEGFSRRVSGIIYSKHARCRMDCRHIDESEVKEILDEGQINEAKIEEDERGKTYPLEGITHDQQRVRIVVAPHKNELVIVTVIDLNKDWYCDCK